MRREWTPDDEAKYQRTLRLRREREDAKPWRNDAFETAARIADRYGCADAARDIRALIS